MSTLSLGRKVAIVLALCSRKREPLGIRFERAHDAWQADWAFALLKTLSFA